MCIRDRVIAVADGCGTAQAGLHGMRDHLLEVWVADEEVGQAARVGRAGTGKFGRRGRTVRFRIASIRGQPRRQDVYKRQVVDRANNRTRSAIISVSHGARIDFATPARSRSASQLSTPCDVLLPDLYFFD